MTLFPNQIMAKLAQLDPTACIRYRSSFKETDPRVWYVDLGRIVVSSERGGFNSHLHGTDGPTPDIALYKTWEAILEFFRTYPEGFFLLFSCPPNVPIPGDTPQAWVRWDERQDDWVNVKPTAQSLQAHHIPADRIVSYTDHALASRR